MPTYEYRCQNGHTFEVVQRMTEEPVSVCANCEAAVERVYHPVAVHFKGSGFYNTDYGTRKRSAELKESAESGAQKTETKTAEKAGASSDSSSSSSSSSDSSGSGSSPKSTTSSD